MCFRDTNTFVSSWNSVWVSCSCCSKLPPTRRLKSMGIHSLLSGEQKSEISTFCWKWRCQAGGDSRGFLERISPLPASGGRWRENCSVVSDSLRPRGLSVRGTLQARILEWVAFPWGLGAFLELCPYQPSLCLCSHTSSVTPCLSRDGIQGPPRYPGITSPWQGPWLNPICKDPCSLEGNIHRCQEFGPALLGAVTQSTAFSGPCSPQLTEYFLPTCKGDGKERKNNSKGERRHFSPPLPVNSFPSGGWFPLPRKIRGVGGISLCKLGVGVGLRLVPSSSWAARALTCDTGSSLQRSSPRGSDQEGAGHRRLLPGQQSPGPQPPRRPPALQGLAASPSALRPSLPGPRSPLHPGPPTLLSLCELPLTSCTPCLLKVARRALCYLSSHTLPDLEMARSRALFLYSLAVPPLRARSAGRCRRGWGRVCDAHGRTGGKHLNVCVI